MASTRTILKPKWNWNESLNSLWASQVCSSYIFFFYSPWWERNINDMNRRVTIFNLVESFIYWNKKKQITLNEKRKWWRKKPHVDTINYTNNNNDLKRIYAFYLNSSCQTHQIHGLFSLCLMFSFNLAMGSSNQWRSSGINVTLIKIDILNLRPHNQSLIIMELIWLGVFFSSFSLLQEFFHSLSMI